jgi:hypothetical protein
MNHSDIAALMKGAAPAIQEYVANSVRPLIAKHEAIERRLDGMEAAVKRIETAADSSSSSIVDLREELKGIREAIPVLPEPPVFPDIPAMVAEAVKAIPAPQDGRSVTVEELSPLVQETVEKAVAGLPEPKAGKDGVGVGGAVIDRGGNLVLTLTDGTTRDLGQVVGKDVDEAMVTERIKALFDAVPKPKNGLDGLGFEDLDVEEREDGLWLRFARGEIVKEYPLHSPYYRGVYVDGVTYRRGNCVTWGGCTWTALKEMTTEKPGTGKGWQLSSKKGRDGKDGELKPPRDTKVKV